MIEADSTFGEFDIICDFCPDSDHFDTNGDFQAFIDDAKRMGWTMEKVDNEWEHKCPLCSCDDGS